MKNDFIVYLRWNYWFAYLNATCFLNGIIKLYFSIALSCHSVANSMNIRFSAPLRITIWAILIWLQQFILWKSLKKSLQRKNKNSFFQPRISKSYLHGKNRLESLKLNHSLIRFKIDWKWYAQIILVNRKLVQLLFHSYDLRKNVQFFLSNCEFRSTKGCKHLNKLNCLSF